MADDIPKHFAAYCEMLDASEMPGLEWRLGPLAAAIELAKTLTRFGDQMVEDEHRRIILLGASLIRADADLRSGTTALLARLGLRADGIEKETDDG